MVNEVGTPLVVTSIHHDDEIIEYMTDPEEINDKFQHLVDAIIDGGNGGNIPSTIIDCTTNEIVLVREGKGVINE